VQVLRQQVQVIDTALNSLHRPCSFTVLKVCGFPAQVYGKNFILCLHISGWWLTYPCEKYEFVSWNDDIPNIWKIIKFHGSKPPSSISNVFCYGNKSLRYSKWIRNYLNCDIDVADFGTESTMCAFFAFTHALPAGSLGIGFFSG